MKKVFRVFVMGIAVSLVVAGCDKDDDDENSVNQTDRDFAKMAAMSNFAEIDAGQTASAKAQSNGVKQFGAMMVTDHTAASQELKPLAASQGLYAPDSLDAEHVALKAQLATLTGRPFDSVYVHSQVKDHNVAISLFQNEADNGQHKDLRNFAIKTLPKLHMHKHHADSLANLFKK
jgi:putative membrane protein